MALPFAQVSPKGAQRLRHLNPWCYRTDVSHAPEGVAGGDVVRVVDVQKNPIGMALWADKSPIALRMVTRGREEERIDEAFWKARLQASLERRRGLGARDAMRLVHGEADLLPGLFVDRYGDALVMQSLSQGMDVRKELMARLLVSLLPEVKRVVCRDDASGRDFEGLTREAKLLVGEGSSQAVFHEGKNAFSIDLLTDMKTGSFLDQLDNHVRAGELARGEGLDCFSYHGGFALGLATNCTSVLAIEQDATAALRARANAEANGASHVEVREANAFDVLRAFEKEGRKFDTIVIDPPGFAKRQGGSSNALRAYHELNLRAFKLLRAEGLLVSCSCSGKITREEFEETLLSAAFDAKRAVQMLERRGAGIDHPVLGAVPETEYLKAFYMRVL